MTPDIGALVLFGSGILLVLIVLSALLRRGPGAILRSLSGSEGIVSNLFLTAYHVSQKEFTVLEIQGRRQGVIAFLLSLFGLDTTYRMQVTREAVYITRSTLSGTFYQVLPLPAVNRVACGYTRPFGNLVRGVVFILVGAGVFLLSSDRGRLFDLLAVFLGEREASRGLESVTAVAPIVGAALVFLGLVLLLLYIINRELMLGLSSGEGLQGFSFRRSRVGIRVDLNTVWEIVQTINGLVAACRRGGVVLPPPV